MGTAGLLIGGSVLGIGAAAMMSKKQKFGSAMEAHSNMAATQPAVPEAPNPVSAEAEDAGTTGNAGMEEARERELQAALLRQQQAREVFTSGLGAAGSAATVRKTLLGG